MRKKSLFFICFFALIFSAYQNIVYAEFFEEKYNIDYMEFALTDGYIMIEHDKLPAAKPEIEKYEWKYEEFEKLFNNNSNLKFVAPYYDGSFTILCQINNNDTTRTIGDLNTSNVEVIKRYIENISSLYTADGTISTEEVRSEEGNQLVIKHIYSNIAEDKYGLVYATVKNGREYIFEITGKAAGKKAIAIADLEQIFTGVVYTEDLNHSAPSTAFVALPGDPESLNRAMNRTIIITGISLAVIITSICAYVVVYKIRSDRLKKNKIQDKTPDISYTNDKTE